MMKGTGFLKFALIVTHLSVFLFPARSQESVSDFDGNTYRTVTIGTQVWMAENLRTTHYLSGAPVPEIRDDSTWEGMTTGAFCNNGNDKNNSGIYGFTPLGYPNEGFQKRKSKIRKSLDEIVKRI